MPILHYAIERYNTRQVELLTAVGTNVNQLDLHMRTPLQLLCDLANQQLAVKYARILLNAGARAHTKTRDGNSVFYYACVQQRTQLVKVLLQEHEMNLLEVDCHGNTPLHHAVARGNKVLTQALVSMMTQYGITVDTVNTRGETAMMVAAKHGHSVCVKVLKDWGKASETMRDDWRFKTAKEWKEVKKERRKITVSKRFRERFPEVADSLTTDVLLKNQHVRKEEEKTVKYVRERLTRVEESAPMLSVTADKPVKQVLPKLLNVYKEQCASSYRPSAIPPTTVRVPPGIGAKDNEKENWFEAAKASDMRKSRSFDSICTKLSSTQRAMAKAWVGRIRRKMSLEGFPLTQRTDANKTAKTRSIRDLSREHTFPVTKNSTAHVLLSVLQRKD